MIRLKMKVAVFHLAAYILLFNSPVKAVEQTNAAPTGMVVDLGAVNNLVQVTLEYSNAVMAVVLPCFSDAAKRLNLPLTQPITYTNIQGIHFLPFLNKTLRSPNVSVLSKTDGCLIISLAVCIGLRTCAATRRFKTLIKFRCITAKSK